MTFFSPDTLGAVDGGCKTAVQSRRPLDDGIDPVAVALGLRQAASTECWRLVSPGT